MPTLTEHHLHVIWIALVIAKYEKARDTDKIMKMALVHDIPESRSGDVDYLSRQYVTRNEALGLDDMLGDTVLQKEFTELWHEYEKRECIEAKIVKDADNLDVDFELMEQKAMGVKLSDVFIKGRRKAVHPSKLFTKTAKDIVDALQTSDPHDWHHNSRTRMNSGDWKIK